MLQCSGRAQPWKGKVHRHSSHKNEARHGAFCLTKAPMNTTVPATLSGVKVTKPQDTKETAQVRTRREGSLGVGRRPWNRGRCEEAKYWGMSRGTHGKVKETPRPCCTTALPDVCVSPANLAGLEPALPSTECTEPAHSQRDRWRR